MGAYLSCFADCDLFQTLIPIPQLIYRVPHDSWQLKTTLRSSLIFKIICRIQKLILEVESIIIKLSLPLYFKMCFQNYWIYELFRFISTDIYDQRRYSSRLSTVMFHVSFGITLTQFCINFPRQKHQIELI